MAFACFVSEFDLLPQKAFDSFLTKGGRELYSFLARGEENINYKISLKLQCHDFDFFLNQFTVHISLQYYINYMHQIYIISIKYINKHIT